MKPNLKSLIFDADRRLRNGWWVLVFIGFVALTRLAYKPVTHGLKGLGLPDLLLEPAPFLFLLLATWACTRLRREPLSNVGFRLDRRWWREIAWGTVFGLGTGLAVVSMIWILGGVRFQLDPARSAGTLLTGLYVFLFVALFGETLFRGFLFQRLMDGVGPWPALIALASLFALGHAGNPGMQGATEIVALLDLFLGAVLLGLAYLRTRSLALPVGLHLGWNWGLGSLLGFGVSGYDQAGWWRPIFQGRAEWLTGGAFGPESSLFSPIVSLLMIGLLWKWKGSVARPDPAREAV
ncbi:MAG: type II CAAX endopeptidase family protein [Thermoanaerobaculia bacterium]